MVEGADGYVVVRAETTRNFDQLLLTLLQFEAGHAGTAIDDHGEVE